MNKEKIISNVAAGIALFVIGGIAQHFLNEYTPLIFFSLGLAHPKAQQGVEQLMFKK